MWWQTCRFGAAFDTFATSRCTSDRRRTIDRPERRWKCQLTRSGAAPRTPHVGAPMKRRSFVSPSTVSARVRPVVAAALFLTSLMAALSWSGTAAASPPPVTSLDLGAERHHLRPEHADEPDPGDRRRDRGPAGAQPVRARSATRCSSSPAPTAPRPTPLNFQVGYYTEVAGLGPLRRATSSSTAPSTCATSATRDSCIALNNFWRSMSNLTINVDRRPTSAATPASSGRSRRPRRCAASTSTAADRR